jgi:hypothetical protein
MKIHITRVFNQSVLIIILILLVLAGSNDSLIIEAQSTIANTRTTTNNTGSSTNQPTTTPTSEDAILPESGTIDAKINCAKLFWINYEGLILYSLNHF